MREISDETLTRLLGGAGYRRIEPPSPLYNCLAWAAGETHRWWGIKTKHYWPRTAPRDLRPESVLAALEQAGFNKSDPQDIFSGMDRIALLASGGLWTHACRIDRDGRWTSKLGQYDVIEHDRAGIESMYGPVYAFMAKML